MNEFELKESKPTIEAPELLNWISKNAPTYEEEINERISSINIVQRDDNAAYDSESETLYLPENVDRFTLTHELVHMISHHNSEVYHKQRVGTVEGIFDSSTNEALTEFSTFVMFKGSEYIQNTQYQEIIREYRERSPAEPGYLYATQFILKKIKEKDLDSKAIDDLVFTYLCKEGIARSVKDDIREKLGVEDIDKGVERFQNGAGQILMERAWDLFKEGDKWESLVIPIDGKNVTFKELFKPLEFLITQKKLDIFWSVNKNNQEFLENLWKLANSKNSTSLLSIDATFLYALLRERNDPNLLKEFRRYLVGKGLNLYKALNSKKE
ncbi:MAG: hypothetical protein RBR78_11755 [Flavobacteriaceae bacterium]|jgi:hypothetical protein|nr:hypothetical protein [Flavobacteriaceae bacterium]